MRVVPNAICGVLAVTLLALAVPLKLAPQSNFSPPSLPSVPSAGLNKQQKAGRAIFIKNCSICHLPYKTEDKTGKETATVGPVLNGLFRGERPKSAIAVRSLIVRGVPQKMPSFQYDLEPKEIDDLIAYLKIL